MLRLDHLVISAESLNAAVPDIERKLGHPLAPGGQHAAMSTHNRLISLGPTEYLEVIAIDPAAPSPNRARWFGLDHFSGPPRLTNWVCATSDIQTALAASPPGAGTPLALERGSLRWKMAATDSGDLPFNNIWPALIEWNGSQGPAPHLPDSGLRLTRLTLSHPNAISLQKALEPLILDPRFHIVQGPPGLSARLKTETGDIDL